MQKPPHNPTNPIQNNRAPLLMMSVLAAALVPAQAHAEDDAAPDNAPIVVNGKRIGGDNPNANPDAPYKVEKTENDKFTEPLRDTPKTVVAIPKEVMEDMGATSFREVVRSTAGVTLGTGEGGNAFGDRIFIRGFEARNDVYIDGLRDPGVISRDIFAVEQIEIIKGPSGNFGGRGTTGGLVSLASKSPTPALNFHKLEASIGTPKAYRGSFDSNVALTSRIGVRVNGLYHKADTPGRDYVNTERYGGALALVFEATDTLKFAADYYHYRLKGLPDFGHPFDVTTQQPYKVKRENFYGIIGRDFLRNGADIGTFRIDFQPLEELKFRSVSRLGKTYNRYIVGTPGAVCRVARLATGACPTGGTNAPPVGVALPEAQYTVTAGGQRRWGSNYTLASVTDATAEFETGGIKHTLVMGGEFSNEKVSTLPLLTDPFVEDANGNTIPAPTAFVRNLLNPNPVLGYDIPVSPDRVTGATDVKVNSLSAYIIDTIKFTPKFWATVSARYDSYALNYFNPDASTVAGLQPLRLANNVDFWNWQGSLVYKPVETMTAYVSYATSSNPSGEQLDGTDVSYDGIGTATQNLAPERNKSWEAGLKWETPDQRFLLTGAVFQIDKDNARENIGGGVFELVGKLRSRGFEVGAKGTLFNRLQIFGDYTLTDAKITGSATAANIGRPFANIPKHSANLLATYLILDNFEVGGQFHYQSKYFGGQRAAGTSTVPGYTRWDLVARYSLKEKYEIRLNVNNVTNKRYYDAIYRSAAPFAYVAPGRFGTLSLGVRF